MAPSPGVWKLDLDAYIAFAQTMTILKPFVPQNWSDTGVAVRPGRNITLEELKASHHLPYNNELASLRVCKDYIFFTSNGIIPYFIVRVGDGEYQSVLPLCDEGMTYVRNWQQFKQSFQTSTGLTLPEDMNF